MSDSWVFIGKKNERDLVKKLHLVAVAELVSMESDSPTRPQPEQRGTDCGVQMIVKIAIDSDAAAKLMV